MEYKFVSQNTLDYLSLHDCIIENGDSSDGELVLEFEHIDVLPDHPLNPFGVARCSGKATLIFEDYNVLDSVFYDTSNLLNHNVVLEKDARRICLDIIELVKEFEVLRVDKIQEDATFKVFEFLGNALYNNRADFGMFKLKFKDVKVCWNELESDAWFVNRNK